MNFINNKNAYVLAFDEVIGTDTKFEGNNPEISIRETSDIIEYLISKEVFTQEINKSMIEILLNVIRTTKTTIVTDKDTINQEIQCILCGWYKHCICMAYEKRRDSDLYNMLIINAGQGADIQGVTGDLCNGIIIISNIKWDYLSNFLNSYKRFFENQYKLNTEGNCLDEIYRFFYLLLFTKIIYPESKIDETNPNYLVTFEDLPNTVEFLKINSQIIGSCAFTNHISLLIHIANKYIDF